MIRITVSKISIRPLTDKTVNLLRLTDICQSKDSVVRRIIRVYYFNRRISVDCRSPLHCFSPIWTILVPKWPWRSRSIYTIFNRVLEGPMIHNWCKFGDPSWKAWRVVAPESLFSVNSPFFANLDRFNAQMTLKIKVNQHHFRYRSGGSYDTHLVQISWS